MSYRPLATRHTTARWISHIDVDGWVAIAVIVSALLVALCLRVAA